MTVDSPQVRPHVFLVPFPKMSDLSDYHHRQEMRRFFTTYVGALYIRNGMRPVQDWISRLIDPDVEPVIPPETSSGSNGQVPAQQSYPQPPRSPTPTRSLSPTSNDGVQSLISLALVNQTASQKGVQISYLAEQVGPSHQPTWTIRCISKSCQLCLAILRSCFPIASERK